MREIQSCVYFNSKVGYIITICTTEKETSSNRTMESTFTISLDATAKQLGESIKEALEESKNALPVEKTDSVESGFWHVSGIKNWFVFVKRFQCVCVKEMESSLEVAKLVRGETSFHRYPTPEKVEERPVDISPEELGVIVKKLFLYEESNGSVEGDMVSFITCNNSEFTYRYPSDLLEDLGDFGIGAYQYFLSGEDESNNTYLAFLGTGRYTGMTKEDIKTYWERAYGKLEEFDYKESVGEAMESIVTGRTEISKLIAYLYQDGEKVTEMIAEINLALDVEKQKQIEEEFMRLLDSVSIKENTPEEYNFAMQKNGEEMFKMERRLILRNAGLFIGLLVVCFLLCLNYDRWFAPLVVFLTMLLIPTYTVWYIIKIFVTKRNSKMAPSNIRIVNEGIYVGEDYFDFSEIDGTKITSPSIQESKYRVDAVHRYLTISTSGSKKKYWLGNRFHMENDEYANWYNVLCKTFRKHGIEHKICKNQF